MRIVIDFDRCESNGLCMSSAPDLFLVDDDDNLQVLVDSLSTEQVGAAQQAARLCPKQAISIVEN